MIRLTQAVLIRRLILSLMPLTVMGCRGNDGLTSYGRRTMNTREAGLYCGQKGGDHGRTLRRLIWFR